MTRAQIQFPQPLFVRLKEIAKARDVSLAEIVRRGMEAYARTCPEHIPQRKPWVFPILRGSGGYLVDPSTVHPEADAIVQRSLRR